MSLPELITHTTPRGKLLAGFVIDWLDEDQAKEIDPYTFKKDGGWFIRARHVDQLREVSQVDGKASQGHGGAL